MSADRAILHSDMNSFYASVEMMLDPKLRGKAVAVCGSTENRHGIVLAKSELAKRAGVKTGMVNWEAKQRCKDLILVPPQYDQYLKYSKLAHEIYYRYTDLVEPFGMDECWLDVTGCEIYGKPLEIAEEIRQSVKEELGLTVSIGIFMYDGDGYIKMYDEQEPCEAERYDFTDSDGTLHMQSVLISYNKKYEPKLVSPLVRFSIVGRVLN